MGRVPHATPSLGPWGTLLVGILVSFPTLMPTTTDGNFPRTTDLLNLLCAGLLALAVLRSARLHRAISGLLLIWVMTVPWIFMEIYALSGVPDPPVQRLLIRWILCGFSAYQIAVLTEMPVLRTRFLFGLLIGVVLSSLTLLYDFLTFSPEDLPIDELVKLAIYNGKDIHDFVYRAAGIFGHPNGAAGCVLIGVPVLIGMIQERRLPRWSIVLAIGLMGAVFYLTKSRGPLIVSASLLAYWLWFQTGGVRLLLVLVGSAAVLAVLAAGGIETGGGGEVLLERFLDLGGISVNADDRWWTIATSFDLMLRNPLGMGSAYVEPLETATGTSATHNAYLELALMGGVPIMVLVVVRLAATAARLLTPWRPVEAWMATYLLGIFAFESYFLQVNIQLMTLWLAIAPVRSLWQRIALHAEPTLRSLPDQGLPRDKPRGT
jgi:hypothetical protein